MFQRQLKLTLPHQQSAFLWGARQTGKSSFLKQTYPDALYYDLLNTHELVRLTKAPYLLREELLAQSESKLIQPVIIDEIQKIPALLNEIHWLIENSASHFILCGSSARQLKTQSTNILGGRAWPFYFFPLVYAEIPDFNLLNALQKGLIPKHYLAADEFMNDYLQAYVDIYLTDEIRNEGLVRNLRGFSQFLEVAGLTSGAMINISNIARDCAIDRTTVQSYFQILEDTLLGYHIYPYKKKKKRDIISATPKFYLFDVGIANYLARQQVVALKGTIAGKSFEHYIFMELIAYIGIQRKRMDINYWRTKSGLEVDFVIQQANTAIEVKISEQVHQQDLKGLIAFCEEHPKMQAIVVSQDKRPRALKVTDTTLIHIMPWSVFLDKLWRHEIF